MESTTKTAAKAAKAAKKATTKADEQTATKKAEQAATATEQTVTTTEQMKGEEQTMKTAKTNAAKTAPKTETTATETTAEQMKGEEKNMKTEQKKTAAEQAAAIEKTEAAAIRALLATAKTAAKAEDRKAAAEQAEKAIEAFNNRSLYNAAARCSFIAAAEAYRPKEPKKAESRIKGYDYNRRAESVQYIVMDEEGNEAARVMNLVSFARVAFTKTATAEQAAAFAAVSNAVDAYLKNYIQYDKDEGAKAAATALTKLATACGLDKFTTKTAADGKNYPFYVDKSFVKQAAATLKAKRGEFTTPFAAEQAAFIAYENATPDRRAKAAERLAKAQENAVKAVFTIIATAAAAAVVGKWEATVITAEDVVQAAAAKKAAAEAREEEKAAKNAKTAAAKRERAARLREQAAKLEQAADEQTKLEQAAAKTTAA